MFNYLFTSLLVATFAQAMTVTAPAEGVNWQSGTASQTVSWQAVDTDATSFMIQLVNQVSAVPRGFGSFWLALETGSMGTSVGSWFLLVSMLEVLESSALQYILTTKHS